MIKIRKAAISDSTILSLLGRVTYEQSHQTYFENKQDMIKYCDAEYSVSKIKRQIQDTNIVYLIASINELPVGFVMLKLNENTPLIKSNDICKVQKIYVLSSFTSQKVGHALQTATILEVKRKKMKQIWLSTYFKNSKAINFYLKNGFKKVGIGEFIVDKVNYEQIIFSKEVL